MVIKEKRLIEVKNLTLDQAIRKIIKIQSGRHAFSGVCGFGASFGSRYIHVFGVEL